MSDNAHDEAQGPYGEDEVHVHVHSYTQYFVIFGALLLFTMLTVGAASIHLGKANLAVAVVIASLKAGLVCTFFMHLKDDNKFYTIILIAAVTFIGIFFALTLNDTTYREKLDTQSGSRVYLPSGDNAPGSWENPVKSSEGEGEKKTEGAGEKKEPVAPASATPKHE